MSTCIQQHIAKHKQLTSLEHVYWSFVLKISKYQFVMFRIFESKSYSSIQKISLTEVLKLTKNFEIKLNIITEICLSSFSNWRTIKTFKIMRFIISYFLRNMIRKNVSLFNSVRHICYVTYVRLWRLLKMYFSIINYFNFYWKL